MGNSLGGRRRAKVMKLDGEIIKFKLPVTVQDVIKDHPDHVLMDSEAVRHLGVKARPLEEYRELKAKRLYFLVQLPKVVVNEKLPRRVRSGGINMGAKERLESLMLSRRAASDLTLLKAPAGASVQTDSEGGMRLRMRLPKSEVARVVEESKDAGEAAEKIMELYAGGGKRQTGASSVVRREDFSGAGAGGVGGVGGEARNAGEGRPSARVCKLFLSVKK